MATASFPSVHCFHPPLYCRISSSFSCLLPLAYSCKPTSINSPQSFEFGNGINHAATHKSSKDLNLRPMSPFSPCEAPSKITAQVLTCQNCSCSQGPRIPVLQNHAYKIRASRKKRTINFEVDQMNFSLVGFRTGYTEISCLVSLNPSVKCNVDYDNEELDTREELMDHREEEPSSRANSSTFDNVPIGKTGYPPVVEIGNTGYFPVVNEKWRGNMLHYLEEQDEEVISRHILELSRLNKFRSALEMLRSMLILKQKPNLHACNSLLSCLLRNGMLDDALRVFEHMRNTRIISGHSFSLVFKAVAKARGGDEAIKMFMESLRESDSEKDFDVVVYNTIISICAKANDWFQMEKVWSIMKENGHIGIDAMHAIIGACSKEGKWGLAMRVYENMLGNGLKPNLIAFNALINLLGRCGKVEEAFRVYNQMKLFGHIPDAHTWNALLGALYRASQYVAALELFQRIRTEQRLQLNTELYNTALMCCQRLRLWNKSLQLLWLMERSGLTVTTASYNFVIGTCEAAKKPEIALQVYEHMVHQKCPADTFTYLSLARSFIWGSLWLEVDIILDLTSNVSLYNAIIQGMCLRGNADAAKRLYKKMREVGLEPDGKTRAMMLQHLLRDSSYSSRKIGS